MSRLTSSLGASLATAACAALLLAQPTFAGGGQHSYVDSVQENPAALDIAHVLVDNGSDGGIEVSVTFRTLSLLPQDTDLVLLLDTDRNHATGDGNGMEYAVWVYGDDNTYEFLRWNGASF